MPVILGLDGDWNDPLNIYGGKPSAAAEKPVEATPAEKADAPAAKSESSYRDPYVTKAPRAEKTSRIAEMPGLGDEGADPFAAVLRDGTYAPKPARKEVFTPQFPEMPAYREAIASIESKGSGDYSAIGPKHRSMGYALGRYQVMEANVGPWSKAAIGREVTAEEFLANPDIQDAVFDHQFGKYVARFGPEGAAQAWFGGAGGVGKTERKDSLGTSIGAYGEKFNRALGRVERAPLGPVSASASGNSIVVDENFKASDPMGLMAGGNPFDDMAKQRRAQIEAAAEAAATQSETNRINALNEQHNAEAAQRVEALEAKDPGRYETIAESQLGDWQQKWEEENRSGGVFGDTGRILKSGTIGLGQSLSSLADTVFRKLPGGEAFLQASDDIDRWAMGKTLDQRLSQSQTQANASVTQAQQDADAKNWWDADNKRFGPAWRDPRSYLRVVGESAPSTLVTMLPGGILARGAYLRTMAATGSQVQAAAVAARTATVAGAISEGILGGADAAKNVRDRIGQIAPDQLAESDAVKALVDGGMSQEEAIKAVTEDAATQSFLMAGVATGMFGGMGDRALAKILAEGVGGNVAKRVLAGTVRGMIGEGVLEEAPQSALQTMAENAGVQRVNPDQQITEGVGEAVASGLAGGGAMGGTLGGVGGAARPRAEGEAMPADAGAPAAPTVQTTASGPIGRATQHAAEQQAARAAAAVPVAMPAAAAMPDGAPEVGATVRVDADGIEPFMGRVDSYEGDEAVIVDSGTGEVYQIPLANLSKIADSPEKIAADNPPETGPIPIGDSLPEFSTDPALEPAAPVSATVTNEGLAPASQDMEANMRFPSAPPPGQRIIVNDEKAGRFAGTVETWDGTDAVVRADDGKSYQVPLESLKVNKQTPKQVAAEDARRVPPVDRTEEKAAVAGPTMRKVMGKTLVMPDENHARLFDLGLNRAISKASGSSQLDLGSVDVPEHKALADAFKVTPQALGSMADDYRYRAQRAAKTAGSDLPQRIAPVNERRLKQWQLERSKADADTTNTVGNEMWWDAELTAPERKRILDEAGVKRSENAMWGTFTPAIRAKIDAVRNGGAVQEDSASGGEQTFTTAKGSRYTLHADGTTTRVKAERADPGHEGDKGLKPRSARTIFLDTNASVLSSAGLSGVGEKGSRVVIRGNTASLVTWNAKENRWGIAPGSRDIPFTDVAKIGSYPLELWNEVNDIPGYTAFARMHAGNSITDIQTAEAAKPAQNTKQKLTAIYKEMGERMSPIEYVRRIVEHPRREEAAIIEPDGKLYVLKPTSNPSGDHAEFLGRLFEADLIPVENHGYVKLSSYGDQIGADAGGPISPAAQATLQAVRNAAVREGINYLREAGDVALTVDQAAKEAATSPENERPEPTQAQKEAGNYKLGHARIGGLDISIENPAGSDRKGVDKGGKQWSVRMQSHYGYIKGTVGRDKDHIDVFVKPGTETLTDAAPVFVVDQVGPDGKWDEHKVMLGFNAQAEAEQGYLDNYSDGWKLGPVTETTLGEFKQWLETGNTAKRFSERSAGVPDQDKARMRQVTDDEVKAVWATPAFRKFRAEIKPMDPHRESSVAYQMIAGWLDQKEGKPPTKPAPHGGTTDPIEPYLMGYIGARDGAGLKVRASQADDVYQSAMQIYEAETARPVAAAKPSVEKTAPAPASVAKPSAAPRPKPLTQAQRVDRYENYFQPGRDVDAYGGGKDRVISFNRNGTEWTVTVAEVKKDGSLDRERTHSSIPTDRELSAWEKTNLVPEKQAAVKAAPAVSENKIFTESAADKARALLRSKLNQLNSGIDPEIMQAGITLAGYHIEKGARTFAAYASAMIGDLGEVARPYLKSWYMGVKYDPRATGFDGMSSAAEVDSADVNAIGKETADEPAELDQPGAPALEGIPADAVPGAEGRRAVGERPAAGGRDDVSGDGRAGAERVQSGRGVADDAGGVSVPATGRNAAAEPDVDQRGDDGRNAGRPTVDGRRVAPQSSLDALKGVESAATPAQNLPADYAITDGDQIGQGGSKAKFAGNVAAIKVLRTLADENRPATREEQAVLAKWVGWGGLRAAFFRDDGSANKGWEKQAAELKALLTPEEYRAAESSTRNAHYTSPEIVDAVWNVAQQLGFKGGQVLEPSVGAGNFIGMMPAGAKSGSHVTGVELDHITGGIAKNLYPATNIQAPMGFETLVVPNDYFDLVIGNPPFGSERLYDKNRRHLNKLSIHNFFFAKAVEALRPGGVLAMVVTNRFLDGNNAAARTMIANQADLVGAIRLPNNAFLKNAGTEVTTDIVILRKRTAEDGPGDRAWVDVADYRGKDGKTVPLNRYFIANPGMMLGDFGAYGTMYGPDEPALVAREGQDLPAELRAAIATLPKDLMPEPGVEMRPTETVVDGVEAASVGSMFLSSDGTVHERIADSLGTPQSKPVAFASDKAKERVEGMVRVRDGFARLRRAQISDTATDKQIENLRERLNKAYDAFVGKNGPINHDANKRLFRDDPTWPQISALENNYDKGISAEVAKKTGEKARPPKADKAPIFTKRTQQPYQRPTSAASAKDALAQVLNDRGRVDLDEMSRLYGKPADAIVDELGSLLYQTPAGTYETADAYLSGNVKQKLAEAERAAVSDPTFRRNVAALRDVQPEDIEAIDIDVKAGSPWVPPKHVGDFIEHITGSKGARAVYSRGNGIWVLDVPRSTPASDAMWATGRASVSQIVNAAINGKSAQVYTKDAEGKDVIDQAATEAANEKVSRVKEEWNRWLWQDDARRVELARLYNDTFNTDVIRVYDGAHLSLPGKVGDDIVTLRPHQKSFVWRTLQSSVALADHTVGAGKTFALIASIMEKRRTGQAKKPVLTVPNHLVGQWAADFQKLYPGAKVLAPTKRDFEKQNRKRLFARVATGDWDVVIVAHSQFGLIGVTPETEAAFIQQQIGDLEQSITDMRRETGEKSRNVAQLAKQRQNLESKIKGLLDAGRKDDGLYFDDLGVDALYVDEFHEFKNLPFVTGMQRVAGLGNPTGSKKATDMFIKIQNVLDRTGGNIVVATGTPLSNTMAEMYTVQRYLDKKRLGNLGLSHFDAWARVFGEAVTDWELSPSGQYKLNTRFAKFVNIPELMKMYLGFADVISNDDIKAQLAAQGKTLPLPKVMGGKPNNITVERSQDQAAFIGEGRMDANGEMQFPEGSLVYRAEHLPKKAEKGADNMLKVMSDARKAALDMRLIDPAYADNPDSKVSRAADEMKRIYDKWSDKRGAQLVFIDLSTPKKAKAKQESELRDLMRKAEEGDEAAQEKLDAMSPDEFLALTSKFSVYDDLRQKLIDRGVPADEIAFIHDANTEIQKEELFGKVRSGRTRFLFGSTAKMGAGTNVQNRLVALHHLDAPWRPSDLEQRDGRIIRQGNELYDEDPNGFEVEILRYATKNTLDARQWQGIEAKARFIGQVRKGDVKTRQIEDIAGEAANAAEMKAAASGNPLILEEMETRRKLRTLEGQASEHNRNQHRIRDKIRQAREEIEAINARLPGERTDAANAEKLADQPFKAIVDGETFEKPKEFGAALLARMRKGIVDGMGGAETVGKYGDFTIRMDHMYEAKFDVEIKGARSYHLTIEDVGQQDPTGLAMSITNQVRRLTKLPASDEARAADVQEQIPLIAKQIGPWPNAAELEETATKHRALLDALKPKKPGTAPVAAPADADVLPAKADKRPDPVVKSTQDLRSLPVPPRNAEESLMQWAFRVVSEPGLKSGNEHLVAIDDDGAVVEYGTAGRPSMTGMSNKLASAMSNPDRQIVIFHNHPRNSPLSGADIAFSVMPGLHATWAIGAGGRNTRYEPTDRMKAWRAKFSDDTGTQIYRLADMTSALAKISQFMTEFLQRQVNNGNTVASVADEAHGYAIQEVAQRAGIIAYFTNQSYDFASVPGMDAKINEAAKRLEGAVFNDTTAKTADAGIYRSAKPVRHIAEMEGMAVAGRGDVGANPKSGGLAEAGARDYSPEKRRTVNRERITRELSGRLTDLTPAVLKTIPLNYFTELARPNMVAVGEYLRVKRLMDAFRGQKHADADEIAGQWLKFTRLGFASRDKAKAQALSDLMHDSTIFGVDPSSTEDEEKAKGHYAALRQRYLALPPAGRELYNKVRNAYSAQAAELDEILLDNVRKAQEIAREQAERRYKKSLEQIRDAGLAMDLRRKAEEDAKSAYQAETTKSSWAAKARMTKLRIAFESSRVPAPYFPLGRFGRYFVTVRDVDGSVLTFSKFEKAADRDRFASEVGREYPGGTVEKGVMEEGADLRNSMDPRMVAEIETILGGAGVDSEVMDMIWQRYLETMPDLSTRKRFIHRKGTAGFNRDALRVFSSHMFHAAHQMAKVKYGLELQELVQQARDQAREADDPTRGMTLSNELAKRHDWVMNPTGGKAAQVLTSAAFVWFLAASPASAALNMTQTVMMGMPILAGRFGGMKMAGQALMKASMDSVKGRGSITNANLSREEKDAIQAFYDSGLIDRTQSHELAGVGDTGVNYSPLRARVMGVISWAFHRAEVWNREVTALAAYRMARGSGQDHLAAIDTAHDLTWKTHFDYSNSSRPAIMQNDIAKVALVFRNYNVNMLYRMFRDIHQSLKGETPAARKEARYQLAGVVGMQALFAGVSGVAGFNLAMMVAGLIFGDEDDDPLGFEQAFRTDMVNILGPELGGVVLNGVPGHYLGIDLTTRIGMPDLWFRSPNRELQGKDEYQYWLSQSLGATVGLGENLYNGFNLVMDGEVARGIETAAPKVVRDLMKSYRYASEGLTSFDGTTVMTADQIGVHGIVAQALGFTPASVAETWDRNTALKNAETRIMRERQRLVTKWAMSVIEGEDAEIDKATKAIDKWNDVPLHQAVPIKPDTLKRSVKTRMKNSANRDEQGTLIRNELLGERLRGALSERIYD
jgi:N12 class adenine-specific DNA methylase/predicted RNA methylase